MDSKTIMQAARLAAATLSVILCTSHPASADPNLRVQMDVRGDFVLIGNTLMQDCAAGVPTPVVGDMAGCSTTPVFNLTAPDIYWQSDAAGGTAAVADLTDSQQASSVSFLELPAGATVVYARLYWGGLIEDTAADLEVRLAHSASGLDQVVTADDSIVTPQPTDATHPFYQSTADVTALVAAAGEGAFELSGVTSSLVSPFTSSAAWYMVVFYEVAGETPRNLAIFDGLDFLDAGNSVSAALDGFVVPNAGFDAKLGVVAVEGEHDLNGDSLSFNGNVLSNPLNPANDFFNATSSYLGVAHSQIGNLPQLSGVPGSLSNIDMDVVDVTSLVAPGDTSATIESESVFDFGTSGSDPFVLNAFITSVSTLIPDFTTSSKTVTDINGDEVFRGETLEYTITASNTGSDASVLTVLRDELPQGVTFVPGSIDVAGVAQTDAAGDDQAEYDDATRTLTVRLGDGATSTEGGAMEPGDGINVTFQVTVDNDATGDIENQGLITASGRQGAPETVTATDSDATAPGQSPTTITVVIVSCEADSDCQAPTPFCDLAGDPSLCVACATSAQCTDPLAPDCNLTTHQCECVAPEADGSCPDRDMDSSSDGAEEVIGTDPDDADTDDDGVLDGAEYGADQDSDGDGLINPLDPDSDNDGLPDGTEQGFGCDHAQTNMSLGNCRPDADMGATITNPVESDTDGGGARDGSEDGNLNGVVDSGEQDPTLGHPEDDDQVVDMDMDGLSDPLEETLHSDPLDPDTDEDGLPDGDEPNPGTDVDGDGLTSVLDVDSDDDALLDGTEAGRGCDAAETDASAGHCRADGDLGATVTLVLNPDTDGGGVTDGSEDANLNGVVDSGETDPVAGQGADDVNVVDTDSDGLSDGTEATVGSDPMDADSDDDGVPDGAEPNPSDDHDGDGAANVVDADSDNDELFDGTELGLSCADAATDSAASQCIPDADMGATKTSPLNADTDYGTLADGAEDTNHNGRIDAEETDPNDPSDDIACTTDAECGSATSGMICVDNRCVMGCRMSGGNGCPEGQMCTADGMCEAIPEPEQDFGDFGGGGCDCTVTGRPSTSGLGSAFLAAWALFVATRAGRRVHGGSCSGRREQGARQG